MGFLNRDSLEAILRPLKNKLDNCLTTSEANKIADNKLSITGGNIDGTLTINDKAIISSNSNYIRTTFGDNKLDFTKNGELKINDVNVKSSFVNIKFDNLASVVKESYTKNNDLPYKTQSYFGAVAVNDIIYIFGTFHDSGNDFDSPYNYKYNIDTDTYTKFSDMPYLFLGGTVVAKNNDIYITFGDEDSKPTKRFYKYNIDTDTYTKLTDLPESADHHCSTIVDNYIYIFGTNETARGNYKYDILTDTYTRLSGVPYSFSHGSMVLINKYIYLLGGGNSNNNYKYDIVQDSYTKLNNIPFNLTTGNTVAIGNDIHLFNDGNHYKYNIFTDKYTLYDNMPYDYNGGPLILIKDKVYLLSIGNINERNNYSYIVPHDSLIKQSNHSIYKINDSYESKDAEIIPIYDNDYYTEYDVDNNIVKSTYPIADEGVTKMYIKSGAILNGKEVSCETEGWQDINLLEYM